MSGSEGSSTKAYPLGAQDNLVVIGALGISEKFFEIGAWRVRTPVSNLILFMGQKRFGWLVVVLVSIGGLIAATLAVAQAEYTIYDGETVQMINGRFATPRDLLANAHVELRPEDVVIPGLDEPIEAGTAVRIQRARPITLHSESENRTYWTQQTTLGAFLAEIRQSPLPTSQIFADGRQINANTLFQTALPNTVEIGRFLTVTIIDNGQQQLLRTAAQTVGAALAEANIALFATDGVEPEMGSWLEPNMVIRVQRSMPLTIEVDGRLLQTRSHHTNPLAVIAEAGIGLIGADYTQPGAETALQPNDTIRVIRVTEDFRTEDVDIPFQTLWQASPDLDIDTQAIISYGENGIQRRRLRVRYENGIEVGQAVDGEWIAREPIDQVVGYGTKITLGVVDTPEGPREYWRVVRMRVTSYTAASSGKAPGDPGYGVTASGRRVAKGVVAIDRSVVAFRSSVYVPGYGIGYAGDTGGGVRGRWIDLGYSESNYVSWSGYVDVYYLTPVPPPEDINYLLPSVLP